MANKRFFQWIDGEDFGTVETLETIRFEKGEYFFDFNSGESMNMRYIAAQTNDPNELKGMALVEIQDPYDKWTAKEIKARIETANTPDQGEITVEIPTIEDYTSADPGGNIEKSSVGTKRFTAPRFKGPFKPLPDPVMYMKQEEDAVIEQPKEVKTSKRKISSFIDMPDEVKEEVVKREIKQEKEIVTPVKPKMLTNETDPVYILVSTAQKQEKSVDLTLKLNLPSKDLYKIASTQFEKGKEKFINCITDILSDSLTSEDVLNTLKDSIIQAYESE